MMTLTREEHADSARIAATAGSVLLALRERLDAAGGNGRELGSAGDRRSNEIILSALRRAYPEDGILSEESKDSSDRLSRSRVWIVDPLDGTREYGEPGRDDWAVHVALVVDGVPVAGSVAQPAAGIVASTAEPPLPPDPPARAPLIAVSRTRPPAWVEGVAERLGGRLVPMGSAGAKVLSVLRGVCDVYLHDGGQYEWDSAAPVAVALAAGAVACRVDGSELRYNQPNPWLPDLLVCRPVLREPVLAAIEACR